MYQKKSVHKRSGQVENSALTTSAAESRSESAPVAKGLAESYPSGAVSIVEEMEVVELDETHIVSGAVN
jgi:hypothetical protein